MGKNAVCEKKDYRKSHFPSCGHINEKYANNKEIDVIGGISLTSLFLKLILVPVIVLLSDFLIANVFYPSFYQPIIVGIVLAVVGHVMENVLLRRGTLWVTTALDIVASSIILYVSVYFFPGSRMTLDGALLTALFLGITEYFYHLWLIRSERVEEA